MTTLPAFKVSLPALCRLVFKTLKAFQHFGLSVMFFRMALAFWSRIKSQVVALPSVNKWLFLLLLCMSLISLNNPVIITVGSSFQLLRESTVQPDTQIERCLMSFAKELFRKLNILFRRSQRTVSSLVCSISAIVWIT